MISCIGAVELLKGAQVIGAEYYDVMSPYMLAAIFYLIMTCMMSVGIGFRAAGIFPEIFVAFFYSGLGLALALAGVLFSRNYVFYSRLTEKE